VWFVLDMGLAGAPAPPRQWARIPHLYKCGIAVSGRGLALQAIIALDMAQWDGPGFPAHARGRGAPLRTPCPKRTTPKSGVGLRPLLWGLPTRNREAAQVLKALAVSAIQVMGKEGARAVSIHRHLKAVCFRPSRHLRGPAVLSRREGPQPEQRPQGHRALRGSWREHGPPGGGGGGEGGVEK